MSTPHPFPALRRFARSTAAALVFSLAGPLPAAEFVRGDGNRDGSLDLADVVATLGYLFLGETSLTCPDAADFNDSDGLEIADPILGLEFLFRGGPPPAQPYPQAGFDQNPDSLGCAGETDAGEEEAMALMPEDGPDLEAAQGPPRTPAALESAGDPLPIDRQTFHALASLGDGDPVVSAPGMDGNSFLAAFYRGVFPPEGPVAVAVDAVLPVTGDCALVPPELIDGGSYVATPPGSFVRGDVDGNGTVEVQDAWALAECLAAGGPCPGSCWDAADADDDGLVQASDAQYILLAGYGETRLPPPGPRSCGADPTPDGLPGCGWSACPAGAKELTLAVEPELVCGLGPHTVTLVALDRDGHESRARTVVILCRAGEEKCERSSSEGSSGDGEDKKQADVVCRWVTAFDLEPPQAENELNQKVYDADGTLLESRNRAPLVGSGAMEVWRTDLGPGPDHALAASRTGANCRTPPTELSFTKGGTMQLRVNLICLDRSGRVITCESDAEVEGTYRARVEAGSSAGSGCLGRPNRVRASAQEECALSVNGTSVFGKGVSVQNGNSVSSSPSFGLDVGIGQGPNGPSANPSFRFGYSETSLQNTGKCEDSVQAFGNTRTRLPVTVNLEDKARIEIQAHHRTWARANAKMLVCGFWLVATTRCPAPALFISEIQGEDAERDRAQDKADQFRKTRLGF
jgi:hypothetical protein